MKTRNLALGILLLVQALLAWILLSGEDELARHAGSSALLAFESEAVDRIEVTGGEAPAAPTELSRTGDDWETAAGFPADDGRVERLLDTLNGLEHGLAVATTSASAERLGVAEDSFERRVRLFRGDAVVADLFVGSGAGAGRSHVRLAEEEAIHTVALGSFDLPVTAGAWQDKTVLQFDAESLVRAEMDELVLRREASEVDDAVAGDENGNEGAEGAPANTEEDASGKGGGAEASSWVAVGLEGDMQFEVDRFERLIDRLAQLRFEKGLPPGTSPTEAAANHFRLEFEDGTDREYTVYPVFGDEGTDEAEDEDAPEAERYQLEVSGFDTLFELSRVNGRPLVEEWHRDHLVTRREAEAGED